MTVVEIARIYTDLVNLDDKVPQNELIAKDEIGELRTRYHQLLMDKFREEGIEFVDRFDAMRKAFNIIMNEETHEATQPSLDSLRKTST